MSESGSGFWLVTVWTITDSKHISTRYLEEGTIEDVSAKYIRLMSPDTECLNIVPLEIPDLYNRTVVWYDRVTNQWTVSLEEGQLR